MKSLFLFLLFFILGFLVLIGYSYWNHQQLAGIISNEGITTKFSLANGPSESLKGNIASMSGTVTWLSRTATNPVQIKKIRSVQQGEELGTGKNGHAAVKIQNTSAVILSPNSLVNFIQMLPINMVLEQDKGAVIYENVGSNAMTVNTLDLITSINRAWAIISLDQDTHTVTVLVQKGTVTEGYEDSQNNSNVVTVTAGQQFVFDDTTKIGTVE